VAQGVGPEFKPQYHKKKTKKKRLKQGMAVIPAVQRVRGDGRMVIESQLLQK
jgi:hypothetical protein